MPEQSFEKLPLALKSPKLSFECEIWTPGGNITGKRAKIQDFRNPRNSIEISTTVESSARSEISMESENLHSELFKSGFGFFISCLDRFLMPKAFLNPAGESFLAECSLGNCKL